METFFVTKNLFLTCTSIDWNENSSLGFKAHSWSVRPSICRCISTLCFRKFTKKVQHKCRLKSYHPHLYVPDHSFCLYSISSGVDRHGNTSTANWLGLDLCQQRTHEVKKYVPRNLFMSTELCYIVSGFGFVPKHLTADPRVASSIPTHTN